MMMDRTVLGHLWRVEAREGKGQSQWSRRVWGEGLRHLLFGGMSVCMHGGWVCAALPNPPRGWGSRALAPSEWGKEVKEG